MTEPVDDWDLIRSRQDFTLWEAEEDWDEPPMDGEATLPVAGRAESIFVTITGWVIILAVLAAGWAVLGGVVWAVWRLCQ